MSEMSEMSEMDVKTKLMMMESLFWVEYPNLRFRKTPRLCEFLLLMASLIDEDANLTRERRAQIFARVVLLYDEAVALVFVGEGDDEAVALDDDDDDDEDGDGDEEIDLYDFLRAYGVSNEVATLELCGDCYRNCCSVCYSGCICVSSPVGPFVKGCVQCAVAPTGAGAAAAEPRSADELRQTVRAALRSLPLPP